MSKGSRVESGGREWVYRCRVGRPSATDNTYDTLQHYQPPNKPLTEDHYANNHILADPASPAPRPPQFPQHIVVNQEATYAVVSKLRPKHRSGPSRTDKPDGVTSLQENSLI
ncbi:hypothetical protein C7M84_005338 [Penaeus vannamei]|uniref:Uncharacterized protein n=1 Tax=Penaeus vannamei TaxID=6689 RepID=A0A3R7M8U3_PENVA|nr:hypothetical protein C7M84_005338 [Penaeus vannamei]